MQFVLHMKLFFFWIFGAWRNSKYWFELHDSSTRREKMETIFALKLSLSIESFFSEYFLKRYLMIQFSICFFAETLIKNVVLPRCLLSSAKSDLSRQAKLKLWSTCQTRVLFTFSEIRRTNCIFWRKTTHHSFPTTTRKSKSYFLKKGRIFWKMAFK